MDDLKFKFLKAVLGEDGARALAKAAERSTQLGNALLPRTILAWLGIVSRGDYEGDIPGIENTYIQFAKNEDSYSGSISINDQIYTFDQASLYHLAASVAVAVGADHEHVPTSLRDLDIQRLGKNIDTLAKARVAMAELRKMRAEPTDLAKAISAIPAGQPTTGRPDSPFRFLRDSKFFDYSHVLTPAHQKAGYSLHVSNNPVSGSVRGHLLHSGQEVGGMTGAHDGEDLQVDDAEIQEPHRGRGLGQHMYEALMAHGFHKLGAKNVSGSIHSSMASKVHSALGAKHGMDYKPTASPAPNLSSPTAGPYDAKHGPYHYAIKGELSPTAKSARGAEAPGPAHAPTQGLEPLAPIAPTPTQTAKGPKALPKPVLPTVPKPGKALKVTKSQSERKCGICGIAQFKAGKFSGCFCFKDLAKSVTVRTEGEGFALEFKADWDQDSILTLLESLGK